jgi:DNA-binding transcriptional ArsR family regulator
MQHDFANTANLLGEPTRAAMLLKLMGGHAMPAGELALAANVSPQTASGHLARLIQANLVYVHQQGRHRYYRLAGTEVADALESILRVTGSKSRIVAKTRVIPPESTLAHARTCYSHLAGWLGVQIADSLQAKGVLVASGGKAFGLTESGRSWFRDLGIRAWMPTNDAPSARLARQCIDWTERRPHLAGFLGIALYKRLMQLKWIAHLPKTRAVRITIEGKRQLWKQLRIPVR